MFFWQFSGALPRRAALVVWLLSTLMLSGCASFYVDTATGDVPPTEMNKPAQPGPVQVLFEFQTKGTANARATDHLRAQVLSEIQASQLFTSVNDSPSPSGALLSLKLNNVPLTDDVFGKGFVTGLTFGLAGSQVTDGYVCTIEYIGPQGASPIVKTARHAIHTVLGAKGAPENAKKSESIDDAVRTMTRQIIGTALKDLSFDPNFR